MIAEIKNRYKGFFKDTITLVGATSAAKVSGIILVPIVTRLYDPDDFGVMSVLLSFGMIFGSVSALRYEHAIVLPKDDAVGFQLTKLSMLLVVVTSGILSVISFLVASFFSDVPLVHDMGLWIYTIPLLTFLIGANEVLTGWCTRKAQYKNIGVSEVSVSLVNSGSRIVLGALYGSSVFGLMFGNIIGFIVKIYILLKGMKELFNDRILNVQHMSLKELAIKYKHFPLFAAPTAILNTGFQKMPVIFLGVLFLPNVVGLYAMASRLSRLPIDIVSLPVRRIYMQRVAKLRNNKRPIMGVLIKTTFVLFVIGLVPFILLVFFGEEMFGFVLGEKWSDAGLYASMLVPWLYSIFIMTPSATNYVVLDKQALYLRSQLYIGLLGVLIFFFGFVLNATPELLLLYFSLTAMFANILLFVVTIMITLQADRDIYNNSMSQ